MASTETGNRSWNTARMISAGFHPLLVAPLTFALLLYYGSTVEASRKIIYFLIVIMAVVVIPLVQVVWLKNHGKTVSLDVPERMRRIIPFLVSVAGYLVAWGLLRRLESPKIVYVLMWIYAFNTLIATGITYYWKISIHGMAFGGPVAALGVAFSVQFFWLALIAPVIVYARVKLEAHTVWQVIAGLLMGFVLTYIQLRILI